MIRGRNSKLLRCSLARFQPWQKMYLGISMQKKAAIFAEIGTEFLANGLEQVDVAVCQKQFPKGCRMTLGVLLFT